MIFLSMKEDMNTLTVHTHRGYKSLFTRQVFQQGDIISELPCSAIHAAATQYTVQTGKNRHIEIGNLAYMNHSCHPNVIVNTTRMQVIAARAIHVGEELTFFYPSTEWEMVSPFICLCGHPNCIHVVAGAKFLSLSMLEHYYINQHIREMVMGLLTQTDHFLLPPKNPKQVEIRV